MGPFKVRADISKIGRSINNIGISTKGLYKLKLEFSKEVLSSSII